METRNKSSNNVVPILVLAAIGLSIALSAVLLPITLISSIVNGTVLVQLWIWFAMPFGLPAISLPWAIGISLLVSFLTYQAIDKDYED